jgi:ribonuclease HI
MSFRDFTHGTSDFMDGTPLDKIEVPLPSGFTVLRSDPTTLVVAVDGGCRYNGSPFARASIGVWFGDSADPSQRGTLGSKHNISKIFPLEEPTSSKAEFFAAISALMRLKDIYTRGERVVDTGVVIRTDCAELFHVATSLSDEFPPDGRWTRDGRSVRNDYIEALDEATSDLEDLGMKVRFWLVPREPNTMADALAACALDGDALEYEHAAAIWKVTYEDDISELWELRNGYVLSISPTRPVLLQR